MPANLSRALNHTVPTHVGQGGEISSWYAKAALFFVFKKKKLKKTKTKQTQICSIRKKKEKSSWAKV